MDIKIHITNSKEDIGEKNIILWKLNLKKTSNLILFLLLLGSVFIAIGVLIHFLSKGVTIGMNLTVIFRNIFYLLGTSIVLIGLWTIYYRSVSKKNFMSHVDDYIYRVKNLNASVHFTDEYLEFSDEEVTEKVKWMRVSQFQVTDKFIILYLKDIIISNFMFRNTSFSPSELIEVVNFIKRKGISIVSEKTS